MVSSFGHFLKVYAYLYSKHINIILIIFVHMSERFWTSQSILKIKYIEKLHSVKWVIYGGKVQKLSTLEWKMTHLVQIDFYIEKVQNWVRKEEGWIWEELGKWKWIWSNLIIWNPQRTIKNTSKRAFDFFLVPISVSVYQYVCEKGK